MQGLRFRVWGLGLLLKGQGSLKDLEFGNSWVHCAGWGGGSRMSGRGLTMTVYGLALELYMISKCL